MRDFVFGKISSCNACCGCLLGRLGHLLCSSLLRHAPHSKRHPTPAPYSQQAQHSPNQQTTGAHCATLRQQTTVATDNCDNRHNHNVTTTTTTPSYNQPTHKHYLPSHHPHPTHIGVSRVFYWATGAVLWMLRSKTRHSSRRWKGLRAQLPTRDAARHPHRRSPPLVFGPRLRQTRGVQRG